MYVYVLLPFDVICGMSTQHHPSMSLLTTNAPLLAVPTYRALTDELYLLGWLLYGFFSPNQMVGTLAGLILTHIVSTCLTTLLMHLL